MQDKQDLRYVIETISLQLNKYPTDNYFIVLTFDRLESTIAQATMNQKMLSLNKLIRKRCNLW